MENWGSFDNAVGKLGAPWWPVGKIGPPWWRDGKLEVLWRRNDWIGGPWWCNGEFRALWWRNGEIEAFRSHISFKLVNTAPLRFLKLIMLMGPKFDKFKASCKLESSTRGPNSPLFISYFRYFVLITDFRLDFGIGPSVG